LDLISPQVWMGFRW